MTVAPLAAVLCLAVAAATVARGQGDREEGHVEVETTHGWVRGHRLTDQAGQYTVTSLLIQTPVQLHPILSLFSNP